MSTTYSFGDRFSYPDVDGPAPGVSKETAQTLSDDDLLSLSSELTEIVRQVRKKSVLLSRTSAIDIFNTLTLDVDPEVAGMLSAARSKEDNQHLFGGEGAIKEIMFADPNRPSRTEYTNRALFAGMIRTACVLLTASYLVGAFSTIKEQFEHADRLRTQAVENIDRIIHTWETSKDNTTSEKNKEEDIPGTFFFEPGTNIIPAEKQLIVEWQSPSLSTGWSHTGTYEGAVETWQVVNDLADSINSEGLYNPDNTLIAAATLSGPYIVNPAHPNSIQYHALNFYPRKPQPRVVAYSINIKATVVLKTGMTDITPDVPINRTPFLWGNYGESLNNYPVNGAIIIIRYNKLQGLRSEAENYVPFILYIRGKEGEVPPSQSKIVYRVQPWQPNLSPTDPETGEHIQTIEVPLERLTSTDIDEQASLDANRFSQVALALNNSLALINLDARVSGAIIRNDPITVPDASAGLELVAWSRQTFSSFVVLDILEIPADIELAVGDRGRPMTTYSSKPRSVMVPNPMSNINGVADAVMKKEQTYVLTRRKSNLWQAINDERNALMTPLYTN